ncbi:MAG TPA: hypothetical protein VKR53_16600 [Puia sp.]|nr:hypothetical protein [Puia sp.]
MTIIACSTKHEIKIDLSGHSLKSIPDSVFDQHDLVYLNLGASGITFYPPVSVLVDSGANQITTIPNSINKLTNLKTLILNANRLVSLPAGITKLKKLEVLDLSLNKELDILREIEKIKELLNLKLLKIVFVKLDPDSVNVVKKSLRPSIKIISTIPEYMENFN